MDTVNKATRSRIMSNVGQKNTRPERLLRSALHRAGLRYRLHRRDLPGTPDLVFPRFRAVVFVHGCFWHSHGCYKSTIPKTNRDFWDRKFRANRERDERKHQQLRQRGWRVLVVWECSLMGKHSLNPEDVIKLIQTWLKSSISAQNIPSRPRTACAPVLVPSEQSNLVQTGGEIQAFTRSEQRGQRARPHGL